MCAPAHAHVSNPGFSNLRNTECCIPFLKIQKTYFYVKTTVKKPM